MKYIPRCARLNHCLIIPHEKLLPRRVSENVHLLCCTYPSSLQRTAQIRLIPQDFVRLASEHFSTASIQVGIPTGS